jgi:hypothetical protein
MKIHHNILNLVALSVFMIFIYATYGVVLDNWWCCDDTQIINFTLEWSPFEYFFMPEVWRSFIPFSFTPFLNLSFDADLSLFGFNPRGFYAHNLFVVGLCAWLIYFIAQQVTTKISAIYAGILFLSGSPVAVITQELMSRHYIYGLLFYLVGFWLYCRSVINNKSLFSYLAAIALMISFIAKEIYIPLGIILPFIPIGGLFNRIKMWAPSVVAIALYFPWRRYMLDSYIGGYQPTKDILQQFQPDVLLEFFHIPKLLWLFPILGALIYMVIAIYNLWSFKKRFLVMLFVITAFVALISPLMPLARPGWFAEGGERYFLGIWVAIVFSFSIISIEKGSSHRFLYLSVLIALSSTFFALSYNKSILLISKLEHRANEYAAQGKAFFLANSDEVIYTTPTLLPQYISGLSELRMKLNKPNPGPVVIVDESQLLNLDHENKKVMQFDANTNNMININNKIPYLVSFWKNKLDSREISINLVFSSLGRELRWEILPFKGGTYTFISDSGRQYIPHVGAVRMEKPLADCFRIRVDEPDGKMIYSPLLKLPPISINGISSLNWNGLSASFNNINDKNNCLSVPAA